MWAAQCTFSDDTATSHPADTSDEITWLEVPYEEKDTAKAAGARWDSEKRQWYVLPGVDRKDLRRYMNKNRIPLTCGYEERMAVKEAGGRWDAHAGRWYILDDQETAPFSQWLPAGV